MSEPAPHLQLVTDDGEVRPDATVSDALVLVNQLETTVRMFERDIKGKNLRIATLEADRETKALDSPWRQHVEVVHAVWLVACHKRRPLHFTDRENIEAVVKHKQMGFGFALRCIAGARFDSRGRRRRNGKPRYWNDLDDIFKTYGWAHEYATRAPDDWQPDPEKVAAIASVDVEWVKEEL